MMTSHAAPVPGGQLHVVDEGDPADPVILLLLAALILDFLAQGRPGS